MKRVLPVLAVLMMCLLPLGCAAAEGLVWAEPVTGLRLLPQGSGESEAGYALRYSLPQFGAVRPADEAVNQYFRTLAANLPDGLGEAPELAESGWDGQEQAQAQLDYQITRNDELYVSVLLTLQQFAGNGVSERLYAVTFARSGQGAGQPISLSQALGLESRQAAESDGEAERAPSEAALLAYRLVWEIVGVEMENVDGDFLDGIDEEAVRRAFHPESDFYLDENGNVVFFIQAGILTGEVAGALQFPFAPAEMLSAARE